MTVHGGIMYLSPVQPRENKVAETKTVRIKHADEKVPEGMEEFSGYCMKCRVKIANLRGKYRTTPNNRGLLEGIHPKCGTKVVSITKVRPKKKVKAS